MYSQKEYPHLKFSQVLRPDRITCSRCESVRSELPTQLKYNEYPHKDIYDGLVKSTNHVILNEVRMKNLSQLSTRFFPDSSGLPQNDDSFGFFYETIIYSLVGSSDLTVLFAVDAKASGVSARCNLNDLRVVLNKPSGGKTSSARLEN